MARDTKPFTNPAVRMVAERRAESLVELAPAAVKLTAKLEAHLGTRGPWFMGDKPDPARLMSPDRIAAYFRSVVEARGALPEPCCLSQFDSRGPSVLVLDVETTPRGTIASAWIPWDVSWLDLETSMQFVAEFSEALDASQARIEDSQLLIQYYGRRAAERARNATPPELRHLVPEPEFPAPDLALPDLLVPQEYDRAKVPAGIWWINYWSRTQLNSLGSLRVRNASWFRTVERADGAMTLAATQEPLDSTNADHVTRMRHLVQELKLVEAQRAARY